MNCSHQYCKDIDLGHCALTPPNCELCKAAPAVGTGAFSSGHFVFVHWVCWNCYDNSGGSDFVPIEKTNHGRMVKEHGNQGN